MLSSRKNVKFQPLVEGEFPVIVLQYSKGELVKKAHLSWCKKVL